MTKPNETQPATDKAAPTTPPAEVKEVEPLQPVTPAGGEAAPAAVALDRNALYILMLNLLYPAVLGTIFYTFLQFIFQWTWLTDAAQTRKFIYALGVVCHYHIDFLYVYSFEVYKRLAFFVDLAIVILLYRAFYALTGQDTPHYQALFICFLLIYLTFLPHELIIWRRYKISGQQELMKVHVWMLVHEGFACVYFIACIIRPDFAATLISALILLAVSFDYALILRARTKYKRVI